MCRFHKFDLYWTFADEGDMQCCFGLETDDDLLLLMDFASRLAYGQSEIHGPVMWHQEELVADAAVQNCMEICRVTQDVALRRFGLSFCMGVICWNGLRRTPTVTDGGIGIALVWRTGSPQRYEMFSILSNVSYGINKLISILFVYHCIQFAQATMNVDVFDTDAIVADLKRFPLVFPGIIVIYDFFYTIMHWALHIPAIYPWIHKHATAS